MPTPTRLGPALALSLAAAAMGTGTPENVLLIVDPSSPESLRIANHYKARRNIPDSNVLFLDPSAPGYTSFTTSHIDALLGELEQRRLLDHIDHIVITPGAPYFIPAPGLISDGCSPVTRFAITTPFTLTFIKSKVLAGLSSQWPNRYASTSTSPVAFDSSTSWLAGAPSGDPNAERYFLTTMLGYSGANGNTIDEIIAMIDRSVATDGTHPAGTFYFMDNQADPARNVRAPQFPNTLTQLAATGKTGEIIAGVLPSGRHDALGIMTGAASPNIDGVNMTILPGAFADHLTSFAATFNSPSQTKMSRWIAKGASGTAGTIEEPCNYLGKFPAPRLHVLYAQGMCLAEAWFRSQAYAPFQVLFTGDPLTRPWAHIPSVSVPDAPASPVSGTIQLTPSATTPHPTASIQSFDLFIDGVFHSFTIPGLKLTIDTTTLADGPHDVRIIAYDNTPTRQPGRWIGTIIADNHGASSSLSTPTTSGDLDDLLTFNITTSGGTVAESRLLHNGRVIAATKGEASLNVHGRILGAGESRIIGEALLTDGRTLRSAPLTINLDHADAPTAEPPAAASYTRFVDPQHPFVLELPATHGSALADATYSILSGPVKSTSLQATTRPYLILKPDADASGTDLVTFKVSTPHGDSTGLITIVYTGPCRGDCENDNDHDIFDFLCFQGRFANQEPYADFEGDGDWDIFDFLAFQNAAAGPCP